jgi:hypothetical protein
MNAAKSIVSQTASVMRCAFLYPDDVCASGNRRADGILVATEILARAHVSG